MGKAVAWAGETARGQGRGLLGALLSFQGLDQDALDTAHVDEIHLQGLAAGGVQVLGV